ncbi:hypothetical protein HN51_027357 [Arachis hypogaea]|uniref:Uncharacterized protein At2g37660, chloroplastic isoform X1 n=1 Tax=Arachis duranensis TaxID=130453 RepID=A0A6P4BJU7_ARADU|nr:uncharacterized protein At2g37660, chloroplastic isoform X1 [Arachis duranensis]XP_052109591.1 uncharacterized protein At2g37660, chloroplastic isoform X2 [Arachis duranensis]XP_052109592.1 uncharacterized protein At2g37660, chloroplastic isoform X3 [Arachis duranensis]QHO33693.1 uncharacterized protein DS421_9g260450 [Arachis hypogaea]
MASTIATATIPFSFLKIQCLSQPQLFTRIPVASSSSVALTWSCDSKRVHANAVSTEREGSQNAVSDKELVEIRSSESKENRQSTPASSKLVLVVGGSGGVGQLVVASLLQRNVKSRLILRDPEKATALFGKQDGDKLQVVKGDTRKQEDLDPSMFEGVTHVICCTGTTAFPSRRWDDDNTPERVDWVGVKNLVSALPSSVKRVVLVSSIGVTKSNELPWSIMNLFGVLKYKKMGEDFLRSSGIPFTIIRPGRLTDGPYTSYDLNTLLKATAGERRAVLIGQGDKLVGEASRIIVAEACIQALDLEVTKNQVYEVNSVEGEGPGTDAQKWQELFEGAHSQ